MLLFSASFIHTTVNIIRNTCCSQAMMITTIDYKNNWMELSEQKIDKFHISHNCQRPTLTQGSNRTTMFLLTGTTYNLETGLKKVGNLGSSFPENLVIWREIFTFQAKKCIQNCGKSVENTTIFPVVVFFSNPA